MKGLKGIGYARWYCGIKSKIPICCIIFYSLLWRQLTPRDEETPFPWYLILYSKLSAPPDSQVFYIRCPLCIIRNKKIRTHICNRNKCPQQFCRIVKK